MMHVGCQIKQILRLSKPRILLNQVSASRAHLVCNNIFKRTIVYDTILPLGDGDNNDQSSKAKNASGSGSRNDKDDKFTGGNHFRNETILKIFEAAAATLTSVAILGLSGYLYHLYYSHCVKSKINRAFDEQHPIDQRPATTNISDEDSFSTLIAREEQDRIDRIISGDIVGRYYLLIGEKGTGKSSMLLQAMNNVKGFNCTIFEAHSDPEIIRIRLGKAINYEYHEDYIGSLFSFRGPRDTTALLDIERAFDKLEEVAIDRVRKIGRPLILIVNSTHLLRNDDDGDDLVELFQQRAEKFAASGLVTMIFNSDDYWIYERLRSLSTRLEVFTINDLPRNKAIEALQKWRRKYFNESLSSDSCATIYNLIGGRLQHLNLVAQHRDMLSQAKLIIEREKTWLLNQCGLLGEVMDDDVMESGKFSTSCMLLVKALAEKYKAQLKQRDTEFGDHILPSIPLWEARQIMTRADYIRRYDHLNIFTIDSHSNVRADSIAMMTAFCEIVDSPGFDDLLQETINRVGAIESLGRTREIVAKDLLAGIRYAITPSASSNLARYLVEAVEPPESSET
ncbi:hypothetical protein V1511DRAFT_518657 [Dipodascopsis uninucleata]